MKKFNTKIFGQVVLSLVIILAVVLDGWMLYIRTYGKEKVNSYTFKLGKQTASAVDPSTGEVTEDSRWFAEVNIYDNCYEILFNYFTDETRTEFYSQGLQFILNSTETNLSNSLNKNVSAESDISLYFKKQSKSEKLSTTTEIIQIRKILWSSFTTQNEYDHFRSILSNKKYPNLTVSNFASSNNYEDTIYSSNPFDEDSFFTVEIGKETYFMKLRGSDEEYLVSNDRFKVLEASNYKGYKEKGFFKSSLTYLYDYTTYYRTCDIYYLAELIYNSCEALDYSSTGIPITFEFGNYFQYYSNYTEVIQDKNVSDKVKNFVKSYWQINVQKHQGNMTSASQSLFKTFKDSTNYNETVSDDSTENEIFTDYHHGRTILDLNENFFDKVLVSDSTSGNYKLYLALKEDFKNLYKPDSKYRLRVIINLDNLSFDNITFKGLLDETLDGYTVYLVKTTTTASGDLVENDITSEVKNV